MKRKFTILWVVICTLSALTVFADRSRAAEDAAVQPENTELQYKGFTAIIQAPISVELDKSRSFVVRIRVLRVAGTEEFPTKVTLSAPCTIQSGTETGEGSLDIPLAPGGIGEATISFPEMSKAGKAPLLIAVKPVGEKEEFMGRARVMLRAQASIEVTQAPPKNLPADGKSKGTLSIVIKDQFGKPLEGIPCLIRATLPITGPRQYQAAIAWTDGQGFVTFKIPSSTREGNAAFKVDAGTLSTPEIAVHYGDAPAGN